MQLSGQHLQGCWPGFYTSFLDVFLLPQAVLPLSAAPLAPKGVCLLLHQDQHTYGPTTLLARSELLDQYVLESDASTQQPQKTLCILPLPLDDSNFVRTNRAWLLA